MRPGHQRFQSRRVPAPPTPGFGFFGVTLPTPAIEIWPDAASAENAFRGGLVTWENDPQPPDAPVVY
jgi:hypothetical protein